jgi:threonine aldolase
MRQAMAEADVGDDVYGEDPTVNKLETTAAELLGKESALFVPTGTMGNLVAIMTHCARGQEVILGHESHAFFYEAGGASCLASVPYHTIQEDEFGKLKPDQVLGAIRGSNVHFPVTGLLCLENTHNRAGGTVSTPEETKTLTDVAHAHQIPVHLDGARLFNAAIALNLPISDLCATVDSVNICLSKGLGAPVGSILAGTKEFISKARRWRKMLGGGMRQAGVLAAAGLIALTEGPKRLHIDHANCKRLATALHAIPGLSVNLDAVQTNMVYVDTLGAGISGAEFTAKLKPLGILINATGPTKVRFVTHLDLNEQDIDEAVTVIKLALELKA